MRSYGLIPLRALIPERVPEAFERAERVRGRRKAEVLARVTRRLARELTPKHLDRSVSRAEDAPLRARVEAVLDPTGDGPR
jgi:hypothetical protein